ncbi:MAG: ATP-binding protein [Flavobacteriaceae bacterium]|nr:ATP-binding protein [Flavobacteriaceae bacterium]
MNTSIIVGLLQNTAILLALAMFYENFWIIDENNKSIKAKLITGMVLGGIGTILMFTPWVLEPGVVFDTRSVMLSIAGLFFGIIPTIVAIIFTSLVRFYIGGEGLYMGVAVIITSGLIGVLWRTYRPHWKNKKYYFELLSMGLVVHLTMISCTVFLPQDLALSTLKTITIPALFVYSPATMLIGSLMFKQSKNQENRQAQLKLIETERRLNYVLESGNIITLFLNTKGDIEYCNDYFLQITGYTKKEVINKNWFELFIPDSIKQKLNTIFIEGIKSGSVTKNFENVILSKNKEELNILWNNIVLQSDDGKTTGIASVGVDTTESKLYKKTLIKKNREILIQNKELLEAKEKAEESEKKLILIADNFVNGMLYQVAMLDNNKRKFNYVSDAVNSLYGCTVQEAKDNPDFIYGKIHPEDINALLEKEKKALEQMSIFKTEARVINPDGSIRWSYYISRPRLISGIVCWDGIEIDITERKKLEMELIVAKEKAEESERLKSAFLANMSHEIRTPMNSILGFSDLLMNENLSIDKKEKYHQIVNASGRRLMNLISDIIDISKIDAKQLTLEKRHFNLNTLIETLHGQFLIIASQKNIKLINSKGLSDSESFINCDETRLSQVISNLLENALKFTKEGTIEFGYEIVKNNIHFYVKDSGIGINNKDHQLIFDRFKQSDNGVLTVKAGSGLGLSISKGIVEMLGGQIWVESEINKGATFHFTIPKLLLNNTDQEIIKSENKLELDRNTTATLLIAEDEPSNYLYLEVLLEPYPFNLIHVGNGKDAVEKFNTDKSIDLILMDFNMPIMSGLAATKEIRKTNKTIPIIALTAYAMPEDKDKALAAGCTDYLSKPISKEMLIEIIQKALK